MLLYNKDTKLIDRKVTPNPIDIDMYMENFKGNIVPLFGYDDIDVFTHYIENGKPVKMTEEQQKEAFKYGRFLTEDERMLEKLKPSIEEVRKAEQTIEILSILQEVL